MLVFKYFDLVIWHQHSFVENIACFHLLRGEVRFFSSVKQTSSFTSFVVKLLSSASLYKISLIVSGMLVKNSKLHMLLLSQSSQNVCASICFSVYLLIPLGEICSITKVWKQPLVQCLLYIWSRRLLITFLVNQSSMNSTLLWVSLLFFCTFESLFLP